MSKQQSVGSVIYAVPNGKVHILPLQIVEVISRKTLDGITTTKVVKTIDGNTFELDNDGVKVFTSLDEVKKHLTKTVNESVKQMIAQASQQAEAFNLGQ